MSFNKDEAHIVYASDDTFAEILGVSLVSLYENSKDMKKIFVYILDGGISAENRQKINWVSRNYGHPSPNFIKAKDISQELGMTVLVDRGSLTQYSRLFISSVLPLDLARVLYLDCDIIINKSIRELWCLEMHNSIIAALMDAFSKKYRKNIGLAPNDIMFNSGVMLIDLKRWKEQDIEARLLKVIVDKKGKIQQGDQGALNAVLSKDVYCFKPKFNSITIFYDFTYSDMLIYRKPTYFYTKEEIEEAVESPSIIHFTTSFLSKRPWVAGCQHKHINEWLKYKAMSPWKNEKLWEDNRPVWKRQATFLYKCIPKKVALYLAGILQAYGRPIFRQFMG